MSRASSPRATNRSCSRTATAEPPKAPRRSCSRVPHARHRTNNRKIHRVLAPKLRIELSWPSLSRKRDSARGDLSDGPSTPDFSFPESAAHPDLSRPHVDFFRELGQRGFTHGAHTTSILKRGDQKPRGTRRSREGRITPF